MPWIGGLIALGAVGSTVRRKGLFRGLLDSALTATPFVGGIKSAVEVARGRDFIADRRPRRTLTSGMASRRRVAQ